MITNASVALVILLACVLQIEDLAAQTQSIGETGQGGNVYLHETFDNYEIDNVPEIPQL